MPDDESENHTILTQNGVATFDIEFLDREGGVPIQPSRNNDPADQFDPATPGQDNPADFVTPSIMIWDGAALIAVPGGYGTPVLSNLRYAGSPGSFLVDATGQNTKLTSLLGDQRWAIVYDTQVHGANVRLHEFFIVNPDGDADFDDDTETPT